MTTTTISQARQVAEQCEMRTRYGLPHFICAPPAPSMVSHPDYTVSYYDDHSILICAKGHAPIVLDEERTYYRDTVEHLASCLGRFTQEQRADMLLLKETDQTWIDGICWNRDGSFAAA